MRDLRQYRSAKESKWGGTGGRNLGARIVGFLRRHPEIQSVLDFGAGRCTLEAYVKPTVSWTNYDPGVPGLEEVPTGKFDLIVSSDVLEHVEPEHLDSVLIWMDAHAIRYQYHLIACSPDIGKPLPDGRNAHLIVEEPMWWRSKFAPYGIMEFWSHEEVWKRLGIVPQCCIQVAY